jgi:hypothetical protein
MYAYNAMESKHFNDIFDTASSRVSFHEIRKGIHKMLDGYIDELQIIMDKILVHNNFGTTWTAIFDEPLCQLEM